MRLMSDSRVITVKKDMLINKIKENRETHTKAYDLAVIGYKVEALKQLKQLTKDIKNGALNASLRLTKPENRVEDYDKLLIQFEWETSDEVTLSQGEFNQYVHDETSWAISAQASNAFYVGG